MPCSDSGPSYEEVQRSQRATLAEQHRVQRLDVMLCAVCRSLEQLGFDFETNPELSEFWAKHKREDLLREEAEALKAFRRREAIEASKKPVAKLTAADKKLLKEFGYL